MGGGLAESKENTSFQQNLRERERERESEASRTRAQEMGHGGEMGGHAGTGEGRPSSLCAAIVVFFCCVVFVDGASSALQRAAVLARIREVRRSNAHERKKERERERVWDRMIYTYIYIEREIRGIMTSHATAHNRVTAMARDHASVHRDFAAQELEKERVTIRELNREAASLREARREANVGNLSANTARAVRVW